jgi:hypothetical protein
MSFSHLFKLILTRETSQYGFKNRISFVYWKLKLREETMLFETHSFSRISNSSHPFMARFRLQLADRMATQAQLKQSDPPLVVFDLYGNDLYLNQSRSTINISKQVVKLLLSIDQEYSKLRFTE